GIRDRRTLEAADERATLARGPRPVESSAIERHERDGVVHREVNRLPEKYRAPIVLCYMEGLTHDEAAASLSWPVGTVRGRLSRGRETLRRRLSRHGLAAPGVMGPMGGWLAGDQRAIATAADMVSGDAATGIVRLVSQSAAVPFTVATSGQLGAMALADGV